MPGATHGFHSCTCLFHWSSDWRLVYAIQFPWKFATWSASYLRDVFEMVRGGVYLLDSCVLNFYALTFSANSFCIFLGLSIMLALNWLRRLNVVYYVMYVWVSFLAWLTHWVTNLFLNLLKTHHTIIGETPIYLYWRLYWRYIVLRNFFHNFTVPFEKQFYCHYLIPTTSCAYETAGKMIWKNTFWYSDNWYCFNLIVTSFFVTGWNSFSNWLYIVE